ncbi:MAG: hypothetical protein PHS53_01030 [Candidatus Pacebacteria bacterium]|nr:hypothetical protein [Candidatus Paceibacterota bacterium]MDD5356717.1 hypothetical protein [Candidatus Paceibacterota bacterium]
MVESILKERKKLAETILEALSTEQFLNASQIHKKVVEVGGRKYTIQGLYKELKKLQEEGMLFKLETRYSLRLPWVLNFLSLADTLSSTYIERPRSPLVLPEINKKEIWHFTDLLKMNDFWSHLLLMIIQQSKKKILLGWNPHPWFHLVQTKQEKQYIESLKLAKSKLYLIVGGNSFLDKWTEKFWDKKAVEYSFSKSDFQNERSTYINVVDDFVVTVKLDPKTAEEIDRIYEKTKSLNDLDLQAVLAIFRKKTKCSIWLENNPEKARKITIKFKKFWGVDF